MPMTYLTTYGPLLDLDTLPELRKNLARALKSLFEAKPTRESFGAVVEVLFPSPPGPLASDPVHRLAWDLRTRLDMDVLSPVEFRGDW